jgi:hypothetical protein
MELNDIRGTCQEALQVIEQLHTENKSLIEELDVSFPILRKTVIKFEFPSPAKQRRVRQFHQKPGAARNNRIFNSDRR